MHVRADEDSQDPANELTAMDMEDCHNQVSFTDDNGNGKWSDLSIADLLTDTYHT